MSWICVCFCVCLSTHGLKYLQMRIHIQGLQFVDIAMGHFYREVIELKKSTNFTEGKNHV